MLRVREVVPAEGVGREDAGDLLRGVPAGEAQSAGQGTSSRGAGEVPCGRAEAAGAVPGEESRARRHRPSGAREPAGRARATCRGRAGAGTGKPAAVTRCPGECPSATGARLPDAGGGRAVTGTVGMSRTGLDREPPETTQESAGFRAGRGDVTAMPRSSAGRAGAISHWEDGRQVRDAGALSRTGLGPLERETGRMSRTGLVCGPCGRAVWRT